MGYDGAERVDALQRACEVVERQGSEVFVAELIEFLCYTYVSCRRPIPNAEEPLTITLEKTLNTNNS